MPKLQSQGENPKVCPWLLGGLCYWRILFGELKKLESKSGPTELDPIGQSSFVTNDFGNKQVPCVAKSRALSTLAKQCCPPALGISEKKMRFCQKVTLCLSRSLAVFARILKVLFLLLPPSLGNKGDIAAIFQTASCF